jgi:UDP-glucuronate decarboxylase
MSNILVTGGAGFIGVNLCNRLAALGHEVTAIDNLICPSPLKLNPNVKLILDTVKCVDKILSKFDFVYHLASLASPVWYKKYPFKTIDTNVNGTIAACDLTCACGARLIFTSTSEVYGQPKDHPQRETYNGNVNTLSSRAAYDESKRCAETIVSEYYRKGLNATIVRIFNTYGPGMRPDDGRVISEFICRALKDEPLIVFGSGQQTRSFCFIDNMVDWLVEIMEAKTLGPFNIGYNKECTINELTWLLADILGKELRVRTQGDDGADPQVRCPDLTRAKQYFSYCPEYVELKEGLRRTIEYFREIL